MSLLKKILHALEFRTTGYHSLKQVEQAVYNDRKSPKMNLGQLQARENARLTHVRHLGEVEFQVFSQFGDDGIIQWLQHHIPFKHKTFVEFGVENYRESNTRFLLLNNGWSGLVIDGSETHVREIQADPIYPVTDLQAVASFITTDNINDLIRSAGFDEELGILSVDIDGNDYWVWKAIHCVKPAVVITEYNALFGFEHPYTIPYQADFVRGTGALPFCCYGTSLRSACDLAEEKGYRFLGCNQAGNNAYFIREDLTGNVPVHYPTIEEGYRFATFTEIHTPGKGFTKGAEKVQFLDKLTLFNTRKNEPVIFNSREVLDSLNRAGKIPRKF